MKNIFQLYSANQNMKNIFQLFAGNRGYAEESRVREFIQRNRHRENEMHQCGERATGGESKIHIFKK